MIIAGIDVGLENTKVVILKDGKIAGRSMGRSGGEERRAAIEKIWQDALKDASVSASDVEKVVARGKGKYDAAMADDRYTEPVTAAKAARFLCPDADAVVDVGADETLIAAFQRDGKISETTINQKCGAGLGLFIRYMADRLELTLDEMGALPPAGDAAPVVNDGCVVFAEMDALSLLNHGATPKEVAVAVTEAAAVRACSVVLEPTLPIGEKVLLVGGLSGNAAFVAALEKHAGIRVVVPEDAVYAGAIGAALIAIPDAG